MTTTECWQQCIAWQSQTCKSSQCLGQARHRHADCLRLTQSFNQQSPGLSMISIVPCVIFVSTDTCRHATQWYAYCTCTYRRHDIVLAVQQACHCAGSTVGQVCRPILLHVLIGKAFVCVGVKCLHDVSCTVVLITSTYQSLLPCSPTQTNALPNRTWKSLCLQAILLAHQHKQMPYQTKQFMQEPMPTSHFNLQLYTNTNECLTKQYMQAILPYTPTKIVQARVFA